MSAAICGCDLIDDMHALERAGPRPRDEDLTRVSISGRTSARARTAWGLIASTPEPPRAKPWRHPATMPSLISAMDVATYANSNARTQLLRKSDDFLKQSLALARAAD